MDDWEYIYIYIYIYIYVMDECEYMYTVRDAYKHMHRVKKLNPFCNYIHCCQKSRSCSDKSLFSIKRNSQKYPPFKKKFLRIFFAMI